MAWVYVILAGFAEVFGLVALRMTNGFADKRPLLWGVPVGLASFYLLSLSLAELPIGTAYSIWTGIGAVGGVLIGVVLFKEAINRKQLLFLGMVIVGLFGIRLSGGG